MPSTSANTGTAFSQTLQFITSIKLQELEKQRLAYQTHAKALEEADAAGDNLILKVEILLNAARSWSGSGAVDALGTIGGKLSLANLDYWIPQAKKDPSFSPEIIQGWIDTLQTHIRHSLMRFDCAKLFGSLFNEWLASGDSSTAAGIQNTNESLSNPGSGFLDVGRREMHEQEERLKSLIFDEKVIDIERLTSYMEDLFSGKEAAKELESLREAMESFGKNLRSRTFSSDDVRNAIQGLLTSGLMDETKRATLSEFLNNTIVIDEVASVLNMRMAGLDTWEWPSGGTTVEMRRHLNGKYWAFTDPEIIDALLLQYIGVAWQIQFKHAFQNILRGKAWKSSHPGLPPAEHGRIANQLDRPSCLGIEEHRRGLRENHFLLSQLASSTKKLTSYEDLLDAPQGDDGPLGPAMVKQKLLQIMTTECQLNKVLYGTHAVIRSDLEWFGPSLPHASILALLKFFGVTEQWLSFFKMFLEAPLRFKHDPSGEVRMRKRGTPISYALSVVCGEVILFGMDFAVNQKTQGLFLYRMHDDLWLWDASADKCATGWKEMNTYAEIVGLKFNQEKTGSATVGNNTVVGLPAGDIRWGFLLFDPNHARFVIDQKDVDTHIVELRRQLASTKSVFGWVNAYNKYMAFFKRNFGGRPAVCFGEEHSEDIIDTLTKIQRDLFPGVQDGAVGHLRRVIESRFGITNLPQGYFYLPISSGGLELHNPMIELFAIRHQGRHVRRFSAEKIKSGDFKSVAEHDHEMYMANKERWDERMQNGSWESFMTFEEYCTLRETWLPNWLLHYAAMLRIPRPGKVNLTPSMEAFLGGGESNKWGWMDWYAKWIVSLYGEEIVARFGGLEVVDPSLIPVGLVQLFRASRMKLNE